MCLLPLTPDQSMYHLTWESQAPAIFGMVSVWGRGILDPRYTLHLKQISIEAFGVRPKRERLPRLRLDGFLGVCSFFRQHLS